METFAAEQNKRLNSKREAFAAEQSPGVNEHRKRRE